MVIFVLCTIVSNHDAHFWLMNVSGDRHQHSCCCRCYEFKFGNVLCYPSRHLPSVFLKLDTCVRHGVIKHDHNSQPQKHQGLFKNGYLHHHLKVSITTCLTISKNHPSICNTLYKGVTIADETRVCSSSDSYIFPSKTQQSMVPKALGVLPQQQSR